eukprot:TRINITY_DN65752_c0_g1_i1.p1 TRINITY_DN65752_c0_g1~~TRINITY_DN65752_c0_g1_i1.p1  ORF type:complete len:724 (+),score=114.81 TRINITY_DN65752_c0_g1_i1:132-2174(+)
MTARAHAPSPPEYLYPVVVAWALWATKNARHASTLAAGREGDSLLLESEAREQELRFELDELRDALKAKEAEVQKESMLRSDAEEQVRLAAQEREALRRECAESVAKLREELQSRIEDIEGDADYVYKMRSGVLRLALQHAESTLLALVVVAWHAWVQQVWRSLSNDVFGSTNLRCLGVLRLSQNTVDLSWTRIAQFFFLWRANVLERRHSMGKKNTSRDIRAHGSAVASDIINRSNAAAQGQALLITAFLVWINCLIDGRSAKQEASRGPQVKTHGLTIADKMSGGNDAMTLVHAFDTWRASWQVANQVEDLLGHYTKASWTAGAARAASIAVKVSNGDGLRQNIFRMFAMWGAVAQRKHRQRGLRHMLTAGHLRTVSALIRGCFAVWWCMVNLNPADLVEAPKKVEGPPQPPPAPSVQLRASLDALIDARETSRKQASDIWTFVEQSLLLVDELHEAMLLVLEQLAAGVLSAPVLAGRPSLASALLSRRSTELETLVRRAGEYETLLGSSLDARVQFGRQLLEVVASAVRVSLESRVAAEELSLLDDQAAPAAKDSQSAAVQDELALQLIEIREDHESLGGVCSSLTVRASGARRDLNSLAETRGELLSGEVHIGAGADVLDVAVAAARRLLKQAAGCLSRLHGDAQGMVRYLEASEALRWPPVGTTSRAVSAQRRPA